MSRTVDERAVIMEFDNKQFESGVSQTMKSLDELDKKLQLKGASEGINNLNKSFSKVDFSSVQNSLESIASRFSTFGVMGMTVISNLTNAAVNLAKNGLGAVLSQISEGGKRRAMNIEGAHFLLQGLIGDEEQVQEIMDIADKSVRGTAFGFDQAAKSASNFVAAGMKIEDLPEALQSINNIAAATGSNYDAVSELMTKITGQGRVMGQELNQFSSYGINAAKYIADYITDMNKSTEKLDKDVTDALKKSGLFKKNAEITEQQVREAVSSKGTDILPDVVVRALNAKLGTIAKRANETFTGARENVKAAMSRMGALFYSPLVEQNSDLIKLVNALRVAFNGLNKGIEPMAKQVTSIVLGVSKFFSQIAEGLGTNNEKALVHTKELMDGIYSVMQPFLFVVRALVDRTNELFGSDWVVKLNGTIDAFSKWAQSGKLLISDTEVFTARIDRLLNAIKEVLKPVEQLGIRLRDAFYKVFDLKGAGNGLMNFIDTLSGFLEGFQKWDPSKDGFGTFVSIFESIKTIITSITRIFKAFGESFAEVFDVKSYNPILGFFGFFEKLLSNIAGLVKTDEERFNGLKNIFTTVLSVGKSLFNTIKNIALKLTDLLKPIGNLTSVITDLVGGFLAFTDKGKETEVALSPLEIIVGGLVDGLSFLINLLAEGIRKLKEFLAPVASAIKESGIFQNVLGLLGDIFKSVFENVKDLSGKIKEFFSSWKPGDLAVGKLDNFQSSLGKINDWITKLRDNIKNFKVSDGLKSFVDTLKEFFKLGKGSEGGGGKLGAATGGGLGQIAPVMKTVDNLGKQAPNKSSVVALKVFLETLGPLIKLVAVVLLGIFGKKIANKIKEGMDNFKEVSETVKDGAKNWAEFPGTIGDAAKNAVDAYKKRNTRKHMVALIANIAFLVAAFALLIKVISDIEDPNAFLNLFIPIMIAMVVLVSVVIAAIMGITKEMEKSSLDSMVFLKAMKEIRSILVVLSILMVAIGVSVMLMTKYVKDAAMMESVGFVLGIVLGVIAVLLAVLIDTAKKSPQALEAAKKINPILLCLSLLMVSIALVIKQIARAVAADPGGVALLAMGAIFIAIGLLLAGLVILGAKYGGQLGSIMKLVPVMLAVGALMVIFAISIRSMVLTLALLDMIVSRSTTIWESLKIFGLIVAGMVVAIGLLGGLVIALNKFGGSGGGTLIAIAAALIVLSGAMMAMAGAFALFDTVIQNSQDAWKTLGMMGVALAGMVAALSILMVVAKFAGVGAPAILALGAALIMVAAALWLFGQAIGAIATGVEKFVEMLELISAKGPSIFENLGNFIVGFVEIIPKFADKIAGAIGGIFDKLWDKFLKGIETKVASAGKTFGKVVDIMYKAIDGKKDKLNKIAENITQILQNLLGNINIGALLFGQDSEFDVQAAGLFGTIEEILKRLATFLPSVIFGIIQDIFTMIDDNWETIQQFLIDRIHDLGTILEEIILTFNGVIERVSGPIIDTILGIVGKIIAGLADLITEQHDNIMTIVGGLLEIPLEALADFLITQHETILTTLGGLTAILLEWLGILFTQLRDWWNENWDTVSEFLYNSFMDTLELAAKALLDSTELITKTAVELGFSVIIGFLDGIAEKLPDVAESAISLVETIRDEVVTEENIGRMMDAGAGIILNFLNGMSAWLEDPANIRQIRQAIDRFGKAIINAIKTFFGFDDGGNITKTGELHKTTGNFLQGFANGIKRSWENNPVSKAIKWFTDKIKGSTEEGLEEGSPSKWAARAGEYFDEGLANGITSGTGMVTSAIDDTTGGIKNAFTSMMEAIKIVGDEEFDIDPTITPVVDTSNISAAAKFANSAFDGVSGSFNTSYGVASALAAGFAQNGGVGPGYTLDGGSVVNFTQNNYSPESLSHYEIYRQTKNLLHTIDSRT